MEEDKNYYLSNDHINKQNIIKILYVEVIVIKVLFPIKLNFHFINFNSLTLEMPSTYCNFS